MIARLMTSFEWEARSRVIEDGPRLRAAVLVMEQASRGTNLVRVEAAARDDAERLRLIRWGIGFRRAVGATVAQVWRPLAHRRGCGEIRPTFLRPLSPTGPPCLRDNR